MGFQRCKGETETVLAAVSRLCRATTSGGGPLSLCLCICTRVGAALQVVCFVGTLEKLGLVDQSLYLEDEFEDSK